MPRWCMRKRFTIFNSRIAALGRQRFHPVIGVKAVSMNSQERLFVIEQDDQTLILSPIVNLNELELSSLDDAIHAVMQQLESLGLRHILLDFEGTDYYGSTALGFFIKLWKRVCKHGREHGILQCFPP